MAGTRATDVFRAGLLLFQEFRGFGIFLIAGAGDNYFDFSELFVGLPECVDQKNRGMSTGYSRGGRVGRVALNEIYDPPLQLAAILRSVFHRLGLRIDRFPEQVSKRDFRQASLSKTYPLHYSLTPRPVSLW